MRTFFRIKDELTDAEKAEVARNAYQTDHADIYNARIKVPSLLEEGSSMGAAVIGGVGTGIFKDFTAIDRFINIDSVHTPDSGAVEAYGPVKEAFESCYFALEDAFKKMARHL